MSEDPRAQSGSFPSPVRDILPPTLTMSAMNTPTIALSGTGLEVLLKFLPPAALQYALTLMSEHGGSLALNLVRVGAIDELEFVAYTSAAGPWQLAEPGLVERADASLLCLVPIEVVSELGMIPLGTQSSGVLLLGVVEPVSAQRLEEAQFFAGVTVDVRICTVSQFCSAHQRLTGRRAWPAPDFTAQPIAQWQHQCLELARSLEDVAARVLLDSRNGPKEAANTADIAPSAYPESSVPAAFSDRRLIRAVAGSFDPTPIEPLEAVADDTFRLTQAVEAIVESDAHARPQNQPASPTADPMPAAPAAVRAGQRTTDSVLRAPAGAHQSEVDGVFGPATSVIDRMGHPSPFVRAAVRNMLLSLQEAATTDELMLELAQGLGLIYPNVVVLSVRAKQLHVWQTSLYRGPRNIVGQRFEYEGVDPWGRIVNETQAFRGRLPAGDSLRALLGGVLGRDTLLFPLAIRGRTVACVALDSGYEKELVSAGGQYEAVESAINDALVRILRNRRAVGES